MYHDYSAPPKPVTNDELLEAVSIYGESSNAQKERLVFLTPRLHVALVEHFRNHAAVTEALYLVCSLASQEWQEADGNRRSATDNSGKRMWFICDDVMREARSATDMAASKAIDCLTCTCGAGFVDACCPNCWPQ